MSTTPFAIAVSLDGAGAHAAAWRTSADRPGAHTTASAWIERVRTAERGGLDAIVIEDGTGLRAPARAGSRPADGRADSDSRPGDGADGAHGSRRPGGGVEGRLDAATLASFLAPLTHRIALVPAVTTTHTEPFHVSTSIATLDHASLGRAGVLVQASSRPADAALLGRRDADSLEPEVLVRETADVVEALRRLWDSWREDTVIRDAATGRFLDRDRIHPAAFEGALFSVEGASITPRPPQGQPPVLARADLADGRELRLAAAAADVVIVAPASGGAGNARAAEDAVADADSADAAVRDALARIHEASRAVDRAGDPVRAWIEVDVLVEASDEDARAALRELDRLAGAAHRAPGPLLAGSADSVAAAIERLAAAGADGVLARPLRLPADLDALAHEIAPRVRAALAGSAVPGLPPTAPAGSDAPSPPEPSPAAEPATGPRPAFRAALGLASTAPNRNTHAAPFTARRAAIVREETRA